MENSVFIGFYRHIKYVVWLMLRESWMKSLFSMDF